MDVATSTTDAASEGELVLFASQELHGTEQLTISFPVHEHLHISNQGDTFGTGDVAIGYTKAFGGRKRLTQVSGVAASFATGSTNSTEFTNGATRIAPLYGLSYALGGNVVLVGIGQYTFDVGGTKLPFAPRTRDLAITPRVIVDLSQRLGLYAAADEQYRTVTGDLRYQEYRGEIEVGIVRKHLDFAMNYAVPTTYYGHEHFFHRAVGVRLAWKR